MDSRSLSRTRRFQNRLERPNHIIMSCLDNCRASQSLIVEFVGECVMETCVMIFRTTWPAYWPSDKKNSGKRHYSGHTQSRQDVAA